jgi:hypothetical protein
MIALKFILNIGSNAMNSFKRIGLVFIIACTFANLSYAMYNTAGPIVDSEIAALVPEGRNQITVFVWEPHGDCVGHASMMIAPNAPMPIYVSAWPRGFHQFFSQDVEAEGDVLPHHMFTFFTDDAGMANLRAEWKRIRPKQNEDPYSFHSSAFSGRYRPDPEKACNCISIVEHLLIMAAPADSAHYNWDYVVWEPWTLEKNKTSALTVCLLGLGTACAFFPPVSLAAAAAATFIGATISGFGVGVTAVLVEDCSGAMITPSKLAARLQKFSSRHLARFKLKLYRLMDKLERRKPEDRYDTRGPEDYLREARALEAREPVCSVKKAIKSSEMDAIRVWWSGK